MLHLVIKEEPVFRTPTLWWWWSGSNSWTNSIVKPFTDEQLNTATVDIIPCTWKQISIKTKQNATETEMESVLS